MSQQAIEIRRIKPEEWAKQRDIRLRMLTQAPEAFGSTAEGESVFEEGDWRGWAQSRSDGSSEAMFVAVGAADWVGCVIGSRAEHDDDVARVWAMWVEPGWRNQRIGLRLLEALGDWARTSGYRQLWLKVAESNLSAQRLYRGFGFEGTGERSGMKRDSRIEMITMQLDLKA